MCIPRTSRQSTDVEHLRWCHIMRHQLPLIAGIELFLSGEDVRPALLCIAPTFLQPILRRLLVDRAVAEASETGDVVAGAREGVDARRQDETETDRVGALPIADVIDALCQVQRGLGQHQPALVVANTILGKLIM